MFISNLYRASEIQDVIEVLTIKPADRAFLLQHRIQVDLHDCIFKIYALAKLPSGREIEVDKINSIEQLYSDVVAACKRAIYV